jgi:hypothetical protein
MYVGAFVAAGATHSIRLGAARQQDDLAAHRAAGQQRQRLGRRRATRASIFPAARSASTAARSAATCPGQRCTKK